MTKKDKKIHNVTIRFSKEENEKLEHYAKNKGMSKGKVLRELFAKEIEGKKIERYTEQLKPPLILFIPTNFFFYERSLLYTNIDFLTFYNFKVFKDMEYFNLNIDCFTNNLDIWENNSFKSQDSTWSHECLVIHKETIKPYNFTYLVHIRKHTEGSDSLYTATLITLEKAIELSMVANNRILYNNLLEIENTPSKKRQLFETEVDKQIERFKFSEDIPKYIIET